MTTCRSKTGRRAPELIPRFLEFPLRVCVIGARGGFDPAPVNLAGFVYPV